jgi:hypothetical protein
MKKTRFTDEQRERNNRTSEYKPLDSYARLTPDAVDRALFGRRHWGPLR